jgi:hypothetical protein
MPDWDFMHIARRFLPTLDGSALAGVSLSHPRVTDSNELLQRGLGSLERSIEEEAIWAAFRRLIRDSECGGLNPAPCD